MDSKYDKLKQEIKSEFSETEEKDGVYKSVEFDAAFSHDKVKDKMIEKGLSVTEIHRDPKKKVEFDGRFMSARLRKMIDDSKPKQIT